MLISVIVPCFDIEDYVDECLGSVLAQTHRDLDVVVVDDGSADATAERIARWRDRDPRVSLLRQPNAGLGAARNTGLTAATGDAIVFLDGDDRLPPEALERLAASADSTGSDIVCGAIHVITGTRSWRATQQRSPYDRDRLRTHLAELPELVYDPMVCGKLFRRSFWDEHRFSFREGVLFEDVEVMAAAHCRAASIDIVSAPSYEWRRREGGAPSITQDASGSRAIEHRFAAIERADRVYEQFAPGSIWIEHGLKVMHVDLREQSRSLPDAADGFVESFVRAARPLLTAIAPEAIDRSAPMMRFVRERVLDDDVGTLIAAVRLYSGGARRSPVAVLRPAVTLARRAPAASAVMWWRLLLRRLRRHSVPRRSSAPPSTTIS